MENNTKLSGTNIVSEFFTETAQYIEADELELNDLFEKLNDEKYKANSEEGNPGIILLEKNNEYIKLERSVILQNRIVKYEKGEEKEDSYNRLVKCVYYIFEDFICAIGNSKAISLTMDFLSDVMLYQLVPLIPQEIAMLRLADRFESIENITIDRVKHTNIKKMTIYGKAQDISDLDVKYPGYDINGVAGIFKFDIGERRIKIAKTGKITFYKKRDTPLYIEHLKSGYNLFFSE